MRYTYLGDRLTDPVLRAEGKCIRSPLGTRRVVDAAGRLYVVVGRMLRRNDKLREIARFG